MDAFSDPLIEVVVCMTASQIGKTEILNNTVGYYIDQDPCPILTVQPTLNIAKSWSRDRFAPMLRDTKCLKNKIKAVRSKGSENTTLHKNFYGGHITMAGANSPASLAARPIRVLLLDEIDRYPPSAGPEGDPVDLAKKRATTFWNRKIGLFSTPTIKDLSRIEKAYEDSDKRKYHVPCPHCGEYQYFKWGQLQWLKNEPLNAVYHCEHCDGHITDTDKANILRHGKWIAEKETNGIAGFWINELYSPWVSFANMAVRFLEAKKSPETLKVFVNTSLGETWEEEGELIDEESLYSKREDYGPEIPRSAGILTAAVDIQVDRIEVEVVAWGKGEESWSIQWQAFYGNPAQEDIWKQMDEYLQTSFKHETGAIMKISCVCIDTGYHTKKVYDFVRKRQARRIFAVKGSSHIGTPLVSRPTKSSTLKIKLFSIGTTTAKDSIFARLKIEEFGPGYMHFPRQYDEEYFKQLMGEKAVTRYHKGFPHREYVKIRAKNEALDLRVYNMASLAILNPNLDLLVNKLTADIKTDSGRTEQVSDIKHQEIGKMMHQTIGRRAVKKSSWVNKWRR